MMWMVGVWSRGEFGAERRGGFNEDPLMQPTTSVFQHVDTFGLAPSQSPGEHGFKHGRASLKRLIVDKHYLLNARPSIEHFFENRIGDQSGTINNSDDPELVAQQCIFKVPVQDFARADGQE